MFTETSSKDRELRAFVSNQALPSPDELRERFGWWVSDRFKKRFSQHQSCRNIDLSPKECAFVVRTFADAWWLDMEIKRAVVERCRPATLGELIDFGATHPDVPRQVDVLAPGSRLDDGDDRDDCSIPELRVLRSDTGEKLRLDLLFDDRGLARHSISVGTGLLLVRC